MVREKISDIVEKNIIKAIIKGQHPPGSVLPSERELAISNQVGRPTVREAMQRLERDGWITVRQGHPSIVNDYWKTGNLMTLINVFHHQEVADDFIVYLLELRISLAPTYMKEAVTHHQAKLVALFSNLEDMEDETHTYASFDWELQKKVASLASNPIYLLILNSFDQFYVDLASKYFSYKENRLASLQFYHLILQAALKGDSEEAELIARKSLQKSLELWKLKCN